MRRRMLFALAATLVCAASLHLDAQVTYDRLLKAASEPQNWLTYGGGYFSQRYSELKQIDLSNARNLEMKWMYQAPVMGNWQSTPLVVDGVMYLTQRPNDVVALDAKSGRVYWVYRHNTSPDQKACCGSNNRGVAVSGDTLFMGTLDAKLVALNARTGRLRWSVNVADLKSGYSLTLAPLVVKDKVIIGVGGGELGIRGFIAAYDVQSGKELWKFHTIPGPGEPGHETWEKCPPNPKTYCDPEAWAHGGGSIWVTGSYDPELNLTYWGVGNAGPDWNPAQRPGDNLYTNSVVALDPDTGRLKWHFQFTPHDSYDYDSVQVPVLANVRPSGKHLMEDFFYAGGLRAMMQNLREKLDLSCMTVTGKTIGENIEGAKVHIPDVIHSLNDPVYGEGATAVLKGNLAPNGCVIKPAAADQRFLKHRGKAIAFENYDHMMREIERDDLDVTPDHILVLKNAGPKGGPGMPEWGMLPIPKRLLGQGVRDMIRISDGRMSGTSYGACILHVAPESFVGGPLAFVQTGDEIEIDVDKRLIHLHVSDAEMARRKAVWVQPEPKYPRGYGAMFSEHIGQADQGCDLDFLQGKAKMPEPEIH